MHFAQILAHQLKNHRNITEVYPIRNFLQYIFSRRKCTINQTLLLLGSGGFVECPYTNGSFERKSTIFWGRNERESRICELKIASKHKWLPDEFIPKKKHKKLPQLPSCFKSNKDVGNEQGNLLSNLRLLGRCSAFHYAGKNMPALSKLLAVPTFGPVLFHIRELGVDFACNNWEL